MKVHLARLAELEYVLAHRVSRGQGFEYELIYEGEGGQGGRFLMGLADLSRLQEGNLPYDGERSGKSEQRSASGRGAVGGRSAGGQHGEIALDANGDGASCKPVGEATANTPCGLVSLNGSYHEPAPAESAA